MKRLFTILCTGLVAAMGLTSCFDPNQKASSDGYNNSPGIEYAPQMYHSIPYDALTQTDPAMTAEEEGIQYKRNTNYLNPHNMNMREPAPNTISRNQPLPFNIPDNPASNLSDDTMAIVAGIQYPYIPEEAFDIDSVMNEDSVMTITAKGEMQMEECKGYYMRFCSHCHGEKAEGDGPVSTKLAGVANLMDKSSYAPGRIFHVITYGKGGMGPHASQLSQKERWMITAYVKSLHNTK